MWLSFPLFIWLTKEPYSSSLWWLPLRCLWTNINTTIFFTGIRVVNFFLSFNIWATLNMIFCYPLYLWTIKWNIPATKHFCANKECACSNKVFARKGLDKVFLFYLFWLNHEIYCWIFDSGGRFSSRTHRWFSCWPFIHVIVSSFISLCLHVLIFRLLLLQK